MPPGLCPASLPVAIWMAVSAVSSNGQHLFLTPRLLCVGQCVKRMSMWVCVSPSHFEWCSLASVYRWYNETHNETEDICFCFSSFSSPTCVSNDSCVADLNFCVRACVYVRVKYPVCRKYCCFSCGLDAAFCVWILIAHVFVWVPLQLSVHPALQLAV